MTVNAIELPYQRETKNVTMRFRRRKSVTGERIKSSGGGGELRGGGGCHIFHVPKQKKGKQNKV